MRAMCFDGAGSAARRPGSWPCRRPPTARCRCASARAACAAPTCTSSTGSSPQPSLRWFSATKSSAACEAARRARRRAVARLDVRRVPFLRTAARTCATRASPATARRRLRRVHRRRRALLLPFPERIRDLQAAPLLCAGLIGYRALRWPARPGGSASTASAPQRTSSARWPCTRAGTSSPSRAPATTRGRPSPASSAPTGPAAPASAAGGARRRDHLRAGRRARPRGAARASTRAARSSAPAST